MNPAQGRAVERARIAQTTSDHPDAHPPGPDAHWVTIDHRHVLIHESQQGPAPHKPHRRMSLSSNGLDFIKKHEAFSSKMYLDSAGNPTIGYGHKIGPGEDFSRGITEKQALELLRKDAQGAADAVNRVSLSACLKTNSTHLLASLTTLVPKLSAIQHFGPRSLRARIFANITSLTIIFPVPAPIEGY